MEILPPRRRLLGVAALVALLAGCATTVSGSPQPQPGRPSVQAAPTTAPGGRSTSGGCLVTATSDGVINGSGANVRTATTNGRTSFSCGSGPMIAVEEIDGSGVTFSPGGAPVTIRAGAEGAVGTYRIAVTRVDGGRAEFQVTPGG